MTLITTGMMILGGGALGAVSGVGALFLAATLVKGSDSLGMFYYTKRVALAGAFVGSIGGGYVASNYELVKKDKSEENQTTLNVEYNKSAMLFVREMELINAKLATKGKKLVLPTSQPKLTV